MANESMVVVVAAGIGLRLQPLTSEMPKRMLAVQGKPIMHRALDIYRDLGVPRSVVAVISSTGCFCQTIASWGFAPKVLVESKVISLNQKSGANVVHLILTLYASSLGSPSYLR